MSKLLGVHNLSVSFAQYEKGLQRRALGVVSDITLDVDEGEVLAIVGASGSGKSLLAHAILGLLPSNANVSGHITFRGDVVTEESLARLRGREIALVPQSVTHLDPLMKVGRQVRLGLDSSNAKEAQREAFDRYGLSAAVDEMYPFELSGGMTRRVMVSTAVLSNASLLVADEPTPGLHEDIVDETLRHLKELADQGKGVVLITHDIASALKIAHRVAVFYAGTVVEVAPASDFTGDGSSLRHPYSRALWMALPQNGFAAIAGSQPHYGDLPSGCLFAPRCTHSAPRCTEERPAPRTVRGGLARCNHAT